MLPTLFAMFELVSDYAPAGDQPQAIAKLTDGVLSGAKHQVLLGVTGSGKTFTVANAIKNVDKPTLVISHNKTLAAQLYAEFKSFFPRNAVEYFVSYFDYYQPEAYIPRTDTHIEKDSSINEEIERLRLSTMSSLFARRDVIVVASVSCIYGIGSKEDYEAMVIPIRVGQELTREQFLGRLVDLQYNRNDITFERGQFRVRGGNGKKLFRFPAAKNPRPLPFSKSPNKQHRHPAQTRRRPRRGHGTVSRSRRWFGCRNAAR